MLELKYYAFKDNLFPCNETTDTHTKGDFAISITDANTGEDKSNLFVLQAKVPSGIPCPDGCTKNEDGLCDCDNLSIFNLKGQILKVFAESQLFKVANVDALANWEFYKSFAFWCTFMLVFQYGVTVYIVKKKIPDYSILPSKGNKTKPKNIFFTGYVLFHPLLSIFYIHTEEVSKSQRATTFLFRILGMFAFSSIFGTTAGFEGVFEYLTDFNPYLIVLPYFTVIPIMVLFEYLIKTPEVSKTDIKQNKKIFKWIKVKNYIGYVYGVLGMLGFIFTIFVLSANKTDEQNRAWRYDFIFVVSQDFFINPLVSCIFQFLILKAVLTKTNKVARDGIRGYFAKKLLDKDISKVYFKLEKCKSTKRRKSTLKISNNDSEHLNIQNLNPTIIQMGMVQNSFTNSDSQQLPKNNILDQEVHQPLDFTCESKKQSIASTPQVRIIRNPRRAFNRRNQTQRDAKLLLD